MARHFEFQTTRATFRCFIFFGLVNSIAVLANDATESSCSQAQSTGGDSAGQSLLQARKGTIATAAEMSEDDDADANESEDETEEWWGNQAEGSLIDATAVDMALLADAVYIFDDKSPQRICGYEMCYYLKHRIKLGTDRMGLYQGEGEGVCVLAASGTDDVSDMKSDFNVLTRDICSMTRVHRGYAHEADLLRSHETYTNVMKPYLMDASKCKTVYLTGHSLGGAIVSIFAGCALNSKTPTWPVHGVYTIGGPRLSKDPITGPNNECIPGLRVFNDDRLIQDPVPYLYVNLGFEHAKVPAARIYKTRSNNKQYVFDCEDAIVEPNNMIGKGWNLLSHKGAKYIERMEVHCSNCHSKAK